MANPLPRLCITPAAEDFLKAVYGRGRGGPASMTALADTLGVAPPTVSAMAKKLAEAGLLEHEP